MRKLLFAFLLVCVNAHAQFVPGQVLTAAQLNSVLATKATLPVALTGLAPQAANTVVANTTGSTAVPTAVSVNNCSGSAFALTYLGGTGFGCNGTINAAQLNGNTFASPGMIGGVSPGAATFTSASITSAIIGGGSINGATVGASSPSTGAFTTLSASSTVSGAGFTSLFASPPAIGSTTPSTGKFTTISTTGQSKVIASTTNAQSIPNNAFTAITTWTASVNQGSNFNVSTGVYTAPAAGTYDVRFNFRLASATVAAGNGFIAAVFVNGVEVNQSVVTPTGAATVNEGTSISVIVNCNASDLITVRAFQNTGGAVALDGNAFDNWVMIYQMP